MITLKDAKDKALRYRNNKRSKDVVQMRVRIPHDLYDALVKTSEAEARSLHSEILMRLYQSYVEAER